MSPLDISIAIHYHCRAKVDFRDGDFSAPAVQQSLDCFVDLGLLRRTHENEQKLLDRRHYEPTEGLAVWVDALCAVPLPKQKWIVECSLQVASE